MSGFTRNRIAQSEIIRVQANVCAGFSNVLGKQPLVTPSNDSLSFRAEFDNGKIRVEAIGRFGISQWFVDILSYDLAKDALVNHVSTSDVSCAGISNAVRKAAQNLK